MFDLNPVDNPPVIKVWEVIPGALANGERLQFLLKKMREHKKICSIRLGMPAVILIPYGAKLALQFDISHDFSGWTPPASPILKLNRYSTAHPEQAVFAGEIEPLRLPSCTSEEQK